MPIEIDKAYAKSVDNVFGEYLATYTSKNKEVKALLFRTAYGVVAHVSFPNGVFASGVTAPYYSELWEYARKNGYAENFRIIMS